MLDLLEKGIKATFNGTTNPSFAHKIGEVGYMRYIGNVITFDKGIIDSSYFHTSYVKSIAVKNNVIVVSTRNSVYTFVAVSTIGDFCIDFDRDELEESIQRLEKSMLFGGGI